MQIIVSISLPYVEAEAAFTAAPITMAENIVRALVFHAAREANPSLKHGRGAGIQLGKYPSVQILLCALDKVVQV